MCKEQSHSNFFLTFFKTISLNNNNLINISFFIVVPCLKKKSSKKGEEVPITLIDLVLTQLERFFWVKEHKDVYEKVKVNAEG